MADRAVGSADANAKTLGVKSGGLVRGFGFFAVMIFGVHCISLSSSGLMPFANVAGLWPGSSLTIILLVAIGLSMFHAYTYAVIGAAAGRSGADYVVASRTLSKPLAFASSWTLVIFSALVAGSLIAIVPQSIMPMLFRTASLVSGNDQLLALEGFVSTPEGIVIIGTVGIILAFLSLILSQRVIITTLKIGFVLALLAWGIIYFQLISVPTTAFPAAWDTYMGSGSYLDHLIQARALGMEIQFNPGLTTFAGLIMGFWIFYGYFIPTYFAGEVENPGKNLLGGSLASLILSGGIFLGATFLLNRLVPSEWLAAESFLQQSAEFDGLAMPWIVFYGAILRPNFFLVLIVGIAWIYTFINLVQTYLFYTSRIVLTWGEDQMLPEVFSFVHPVLRSPLIPVLVVSIIAEFGLVNAALNSALTSQLNFVFFVVLTQLVPVLAITLMPFLKREWFESCSKLVRLKVGPVPVITPVGLVTLIYLGWVIVANVRYPVFGGIHLGTIVSFAVMFLSGLVWYYIRAGMLRQQDQPLPPSPAQTPAD